jgi:hypothetical protein
VLEVVFDLHVAALLALARCDGCLDTHLMVQRTEEWLELRDCPVVGLGRRGRLAPGAGGAPPGPAIAP